MQPMTRRMLMKRGRCPHIPCEGDREQLLSSVVDKKHFCSHAQEMGNSSKPLDIKETVDLNTNGFKR